jgi:hypothetical protein
MPPFLKMKSNADPTWYLHGGTDIDFSDVPKSSMDDRTKALIEWSWPGGVVAIEDEASGTSLEFLSVPITVVKFDKSKLQPRWMFDLMAQVAETTSSFELQNAARTDDVDTLLKLKDEVNSNSWSGKFARGPFKKLMDESNALAHAVARSQLEAARRLVDGRKCEQTPFGWRQCCSGPR